MNSNFNLFQNKFEKLKCAMMIFLDSNFDSWGVTCTEIINHA